MNEWATDCIFNLFSSAIWYPVIHTGAHLVNAVNCSLYYNHRWIEVNIAESAGQDPFQLVFFTRNSIAFVLLPCDIEPE